MEDDLAREDYVWHFKLSNAGDPSGPADEALTEMVRCQLQALLSCVVLTHRGADLKVTGFRFLDAHGIEHAIQPGIRRWAEEGNGE